jgi:hypothetical protein
LQENPFHIALKGDKDGAAGKDGKRDVKQSPAKKK